MKFNHRAPIERMAKIASKLVLGDRFNFNTLAAEFEVDRKTVQRDVEFMRDRLGYVIEWKAKGLSKESWTYAGHAPKERVL